MTHLTLTGFYAGTPICGVDRGLAAIAGDTFQHPCYNSRDLASQLAHPNLCPACKAEWNRED